MTTKQELINWMEETRENLTFENKVQLIWDFWTLREYLKLKEPEYQKKIQELENDNFQLEGIIEEKEQQVEKLENKSHSLLNKELSETEIKQELTGLETFFSKVALPNTYNLFQDTWQQLLAVSELLSRGTWPVIDYEGKSDSELITKIQELEKNKQQIQQEKKELLKQKEQTEKEINRLKEELAKKPTETATDNEEVKQLRKDKKSLENDLLANNNQIKLLQEQNKQLNQQIANLAKNKGVIEGLRQTFQNNLNLKDKEIQALQQTYNKLNGEYKTLDKKKKNLETELSTLKKTRDSQAEDLKLVNRLLAEQNKEIAELKKQLKEKEPKETNWSQVLQEIYEFASQKPTSLAAVKEFISKYPDPLAGIDLAGWPKDKLLNLNKDNSVQTQLKLGKGDFKVYQNWTALSASGDNNCFLNSFSLLLVGNESLAVRLRVAMCLLLMKEPWRLGGVASDSEQDHLNRLIDKLTVNKDDLTKKSWPLAKDKQFMYTDDINFVSVLLKRPLRVLYFPLKEQFVPPHGSKENQAKGEIGWKKFNENTGGMAMLAFKGDSRDSEWIEYAFHEYWTIYNINAIHFVPLVEGKK